MIPQTDWPTVGLFYAHKTTGDIVEARSIARGCTVVCDGERCIPWTKFTEEYEDAESIFHQQQAF